MLRSLAIGYGRRSSPLPDAVGPRHGRATTLITYTENAFTNAVDERRTHHRTPLPAETRTYELTGFSPADSAARFSFERMDGDGGFASLRTIRSSAAHRKRLLIEHVRTLYRRGRSERARCRSATLESRPCPARPTGWR